MGFHLLGPSKKQHTGDVIAQLRAGEEVGERGEKISEHEACAEQGVLRLEWLLGYRISVQTVSDSNMFFDLQAKEGFNIMI